MAEFTEVHRSPLGPIINLPRRLVWKLVRPYFMNLLESNDEVLGRVKSQSAAVKKELLATNHRISWLERELAETRAELAELKARR